MFWSVYISNQTNQVSRRLVVPVGKRLEIHNVAVRLSLSQLPEEWNGFGLIEWTLSGFMEDAQ
jgi:hypothetical protein